MVGIQLRVGESIDGALRRFKRKCLYAGVIRDAKKSRYYIKPSDKKKMAKIKAIRRRRLST